MDHLGAIHRRAHHLMSTVGEEHLGQTLQSLGWTLRFDRARRRLGVCHWEHSGRRLRILSLSRFYSVRIGWTELEDVVRHEIAHAIDYETRGKSDHGPVWKSIARRVGADPTRLYEGADVADVDSKYVGQCPACEKEHPFYRRVSRVHACPECCRRHNGGRFAARFTLRMVERETGREITPFGIGGSAQEGSRVRVKRDP